LKKLEGTKEKITTNSPEKLFEPLEEASQFQNFISQEMETILDQFVCLVSD